MNKTMLKEPSSGASSRVEGVKVGFILCVCFLDSRVSLCLILWVINIEHNRKC